MATEEGECHMQKPHRPTPGDVLGPMYFVKKPPERGRDLVKNPTNGAIAMGTVIYICGRVFDVWGEPIAHACVELWGANRHGRYKHPADSNQAPLDPDFDGYGICQTDGLGFWYFTTIRPGGYPAEDGWIRPPHLHILVTTDYCELCTQIYFPEEALLNTRDDFFGIHRKYGDAGLITAECLLVEAFQKSMDSKIEIAYGFDVWLPTPVDFGGY